MIIIKNGEIIVHRLECFDAAKHWVENNYNIAFIEDDADYNDCADALTMNGEVISIQPENLIVKPWL